MNRAAVWVSSGGKDSLLALHRARAQGWDVRWMLTMMDESGQRNRSHGLPRDLLQAQADALGLRLITASASWDDYQTVFDAALARLAEQGARAAITGDIDLQPHRDWVEAACARAGVQPLLPLWGQPRKALVPQMLALGLRARVVCVDTRFVPDAMCGRLFDADFIAALPAGVDACGEGGEFHTFAFGGPGFTREVAHRVQGLREWVSPPRFGQVRYVFADLAREDDHATA